MKVKTPFQDVVAAHGETVFRVCRVVVGPVDADDAWSETFLAALRAWPDLDEGANVEAWLVTIAHRKAIDVVRSRGRRPEPTGNLAEVAGISVPRVGLADAPWQWPPPEDDALEVWDVVKRLPDKQRQVIAYRFYAGLAYADIAEIVGGSEEAARRAASDGLKTLRLWMVDDGDDGLKGAA